MQHGAPLETFSRLACQSEMALANTVKTTTQHTDLCIKSSQHLQLKLNSRLVRNKGAAVGDSPPFVPVSQSWLHRRCAHRGGRERRRLLFRPGALFTPEGPVHCQVH